jgi:hypothetical protein
MTLKIFQRQYDFKNNWLQHKLMMPIFIALLSKLYIWAFTQFKEHEKFENKRDNILNIIKNNHDDLKSFEKPIFTLEVILLKHILDYF